MKLEMNDKKMNKDLKKMLDKNTPTVSRRQLAQNILKNQKFINKYKNLEEHKSYEDEEKQAKLNYEL